VEALYSPARWSRENLLELAATSGHRRGKVAVIGAGPAGLAAAHDLVTLGHEVTIYEAGPKTGGMARYGVPVYRINQQAMDSEIQSILNLGVKSVSRRWVKMSRWPSCAVSTMRSSWHRPDARPQTQPGRGQPRWSDYGHRPDATTTSATK
jgi:cation diffusion facilitator CzcD-associated flavoprotein CzcO